MNSLSHIAIIMDGNGRWAKKRNKSRNFGHKAGLLNIKKIIERCIILKIKYLSLYVFSLDNWKRSKSEISYLFKLISDYINRDVDYLLKKKIKIRFLGEKYKLNKKLLISFRKIETITKKNNNITLNLLFNYSSKKEIINIVNKLIKNKKKVTVNDIDKNLHFYNAPDPEILIRTGGNCRLSDFLLWQVSYTEIFFIKKLWPDFNSRDLNNIIKNFYNIKRNFGSINE